MNTEKTLSASPNIAHGSKKHRKQVLYVVIITVTILLFLFIVYVWVALKLFFTPETTHKETELSPDGKYELILCNKEWLKLINIEVHCQKEGSATKKCIGELPLGPRAERLRKEYYQVSWMDNGRTVGIRYYAGYPEERVEDPATWRYEELTIPSSVINSPSLVTVILIMAFSGVIIAGIIVCAVILLVKKKTRGTPDVFI